MRPQTSQLILLVTAAGLGLVAYASVLLPPFPVPAWLVAWALGNETIYPLGLAIVYWLWCRPLRRGGNLYPRRTLVLGGIAAGLSALYFSLSWRYGVQYQGVDTLAWYVGLNTVFLTALAWGWRRGTREASWWGSLAVHWGLFAWLCTLAFPLLGELP